MFKLQRNCQITSHGGWTILHAHQQWVPVASHPCWHLLFSFLKKSIVILVGMKWCLIVILIFVSNDYVECLFMFLLMVYIYLEKCLFKFSAHFFEWSFYCWPLGILYILWLLNTYQTWFANVFSHSVVFPLWVSSDAQKFLILMNPIYLVFLFSFMLLVSYFRLHCQIQGHENLPIFF